jgi:hypothetical protein
VVSIDVLPDDVLLAIFDFCPVQYQIYPCIPSTVKKKVEAWVPLVQVCRRWQCVIFGSPLRLDLRLYCTPKTPARDTLDVWPALPLLIQGETYREEDVDNVVAALERSDCVCLIGLTPFSSSHLETLSAAMQVPFPELTYLNLRLWSYGGLVLPDSFLGGSAPRLQRLQFIGIPFPGLPNLLLSATHLVELYLNFPHSGHFSHEAMFTALSTLTHLDILMLEFQSPLSRPDRASRRPPPSTRSILPVFTYFLFKGDSEFLGDLVAHIDAPRLNRLDITFFNDILFDTPQLMRFICRTPTLKPLEKAEVNFGGDFAEVYLSSLTSRDSRDDLLRVKLSCRELNWQVSLVHQVFTSCLPPLSALEGVYITENPYLPAHWHDNIENVLWLELLHPFRTVKNLYLNKKVAPRIVPALQELIGSRATEVLPNLQNIFLQGLEPSGPVQEGIQQFVATRQVISNAIAVSPWHPEGRWS